MVITKQAGSVHPGHLGTYHRMGVFRRQILWTLMDCIIDTIHSDGTVYPVRDYLDDPVKRRQYSRAVVLFIDRVKDG